MNDTRSVKSFLSFYVLFIKIITETVGVILQDWFYQLGCCC